MEGRGAVYGNNCGSGSSVCRHVFFKAVDKWTNTRHIGGVYALFKISFLVSGKHWCVKRYGFADGCIVKVAYELDFVAEHDCIVFADVVFPDE